MLFDNFGLVGSIGRLPSSPAAHYATHDAASYCGPTAALLRRHHQRPVMPLLQPFMVAVAYGAYALASLLATLMIRSLAYWLLATSCDDGAISRRSQEGSQAQLLSFQPRSRTPATSLANWLAMMLVASIPI